MECKGKDCEHIFFEREDDYICCPACGELREDKLPQDSFKRFQIIALSFKVKRLVRFEELIFKIFVYSFVAAGLLYILSGYPVEKAPTRGGPATVLLFYIGCLTVAHFLVFVYYDGKIMFLKRKIGEEAYLFTTLPFKIIKWIILVIVLFFIYDFVFPYFYESFKQEYIDDYGASSLRNLVLLLDLEKIALVVQFTLYIIVDLIELMKVKMCRDMIRIYKE